MKSNILVASILAVPMMCAVASCGSAFSEQRDSRPPVDTTDKESTAAAVTAEPPALPAVPDSAEYFAKTKYVANGDTTGKWPVQTSLPVAGAILPYKRIIAYYGNLYSTRMGILGEYAPSVMRAKLQDEVKRWEVADPNTPVQPALHYIAVTAQGSPGKGGKYRLRMPFNQIDSVLNMAKPLNAIVFLDIQVGLSTLQDEIPLLEKYLAMPNVHLGIDPEFSMKGGDVPGKRIGTFDAADVNYASGYLADLVKKHNLPAKILVVHRFTKAMVTNSKDIKVRPEVQTVMHMDGWGAPARKINTYRQFIYKEPVEFTGFKLFYKNDLKETPGRMMTPDELVKLKPMPMYIQYQ
ncbi:hypothetical protein [Flavihumibacter petaseus]|uniref:Lipoprotein n=1 Tax=Flavihumibacter petaseus NBRC 106054 TaxID=1220578 RepID=A0A0E9N1Z2_9BACT|nr:hypothetical protein [Flavihumibacter petaseus]GAO43656.1 hypothetical protein FPE01S_02_07620 [Flavihumibacter petaseus NBRC 106054]